MLMTAAPLFIGFLVTMTMMLALRSVAPQLGLVDVPGGRKTHAGKVPVIGGIAIFLGLLAAVLALDVLDPPQAPLLVAAALMVLVGAMDDRFDLPPNSRILAHVAASMTLVLASGYRVDNLGNLLGAGEILLGAFAFCFTVVATIALVNAFNMLDGMDGLAGSVAFVALVGLSVIFWGRASGGLLISLALLGSTAAFLIFNLPARFNRRVLAFMGDAGSTLMGFLLAGLALLAVQPEGAGIPAVVVLWLLPVPILELFTSTFRRVATGLSPMQADRGHFHYKLLEAGFSVQAIFVLYLLTSTISAVAGIWAWKAGVSEPALFYSFVVFAAIWVLATRDAKRLTSYLPQYLKTGDLHPSRRVRRVKSIRPTVDQSQPAREPVPPRRD